MIRETDNGAKSLMKRIDKKASVRVGIFGDEASAHHSDSDLTVGEIAAIHELGLGRVPARSIVAEYVDEQIDEIEGLLKSAAKEVFLGKTLLSELVLVGQKTSGRMRQRMTQGIPPPLADGSGRTPLIKTGELRDAIDYEVE